MSTWRQLLELVEFAVDEDGVVWMVTDDQTATRWTVTVIRRREGVTVRSVARRHEGVPLDIYATWEPGERGIWVTEPVAFDWWTYGWPITDDNADHPLQQIELAIDFGDGTSASFP